MQTLKIEIPKGYEFESFDKVSGELKLREKPKNVMERIKTVADVLDDNGIMNIEFNMNCQGLTEDEVDYKILKLLTKSLNEGWTPDWSNSSQPKYFPWFEMKGSSGFRFNGCDHWAATSGVGSRLCFKSRELAEYAGKQFTAVYKQFMIIE